MPSHFGKVVSRAIDRGDRNVERADSLERCRKLAARFEGAVKPCRSRASLALIDMYLVAQLYCTRAIDLGNWVESELQPSRGLQGLHCCHLVCRTSNSMLCYTSTARQFYAILTTPPVELLHIMIR